MWGVVAVFVHIEWGVVLFDIWSEYSCSHIQIDVEEVHRFNVRRNSNVETITLEDPANFFLGIFRVPCTERTSSQAVISVYTNIDVKMGQLRQQK